MNYLEPPEGYLDIYIENARSISKTFLTMPVRPSIAHGTPEKMTAFNVIEDQFSVAGILATSVIEPGKLHSGHVVWEDVAPSRTGHTSLVASHLMSVAIPYFWTDEMRMAAASQSKLPAHNVVDLHAPHELMWWRWEKGVQIENVPNREGFGHLIQFVDDGIVLVDVGMRYPDDRSTGVPNAMFGTGYIAYNDWKYPDDFPSEVVQTYEFIAKLIAFINSPFITVHKEQPARAGKRQLEKKRIQIPDEGVNFVILRRGVRDEDQVSQGPGRTLTARILTSGHYKNHWWPLEQVHKLTWIAPYFRGPEDAPVRPRGYKVVR